MRKILLAMVCLLATTSFAQTAREVLDKTSAYVSQASGAQASFTMLSKVYGNTSGTIAIKGRKFYATTPMALVWFDGKTQWTYMRNNNEVNVSNPTEEQLQSLNPYNFINMYRSGYKMAVKTIGNTYEVHLKALNKKRRVSQMYIIVNKHTFAPTHVKMRTGGKWSTIIIRSLTHRKLPDAMFRFNNKDYPTAEVIDLR